VTHTAEGNELSAGMFRECASDYVTTALRDVARCVSGDARPAMVAAADHLIPMHVMAFLGQVRSHKATRKLLFQALNLVLQDRRDLIVENAMKSVIETAESPSKLIQ
jgi:hypothetical protein